MNWGTLMALVFSRREGESFSVGGMDYVVAEVSPDHVTLYDQFGIAVPISEGSTVELMPRVTIREGGRANPRVAKFSIEAPKSVIIIRH